MKNVDFFIQRGITMTDIKYYYPENMDSACKLLKNQRNLLINGASSVKFRNLDRYDGMVDVSRLLDKNIKEEGGHILLGPSMKISQLVGYKNKESSLDILGIAAENIGTTPIRNQVSLGGNVTMIYPWSDLPVVMLCLDAEMKTYLDGETYSYSTEEYYDKQPISLIEKGEILTGIKIKKVEGRKAAFLTFNKSQGDFAAMDVACSYKLDEYGSMINLHIAVSGVYPLPKRVSLLEEELEGKEPEESSVSEIIKKWNFTISGRDFKYSKNYLEKVLKVMVRRSIQIDISSFLEEVKS